MNTIHRAGLTVAGLVTVVVVAGAFVAQGYVAAKETVAATATAEPTLEPQIIYVNPAPTPAIVHVTQTAPPATNPPVIHVIVPSTGERDDDGGDD